MQKIKYLVGSKLVNDQEVIIIKEITSNGFACIAATQHNDLRWHWYNQAELDHYDYTLVSSPRWIPKEGIEKYWFYDGGEAWTRFWEGDSADIFHLKQDNVFKTEEECQKKIDEINSREI